jgi:hypothetical protein
VKKAKAIIEFRNKNKINNNENGGKDSTQSLIINQSSFAL